MADHDGRYFDKLNRSAIRPQHRGAIKTKHAFYGLIRLFSAPHTSG